MRRRIESLKPFPFESDFSAPKADDPNLITMSAMDLAALLADTRESTAALVRDETLSAESERIANVADNLKQALTAIVHLAAHLENAAIDEADRQQALHNVRRLASTLIEGQGELFTKNTAHSPVGNHSD
jgi:hypothetical protein